MSRAAYVTLAATVAFALSGLAAGLLIHEHGGAAGAAAWVARTAVIVSLAVALGGGLLLILRLRRRVRPRAAGWALTVVAVALFAFFVVQPAVFAVYLTHLPARRAVHDADLGAPKRDVTLTTASGLKLRGWYVPSRNGAAVLLIHGTGSNRVGVAGHARLLVRHGYGVLLMDLHGHGTSEGRSTSVGWDADEDTDAALDFLRRQPDVHGGRIGILGVSLGGEVAIEAAARHPEWRAAVLEGVQGGTPADVRAMDADPASTVTLLELYGLGRLLAGSAPPPSRAGLIEEIAPRPVLLLSSGRGGEARANEAMLRRGGSTTQLWNLPAASHASALRTDPTAYERRVVGFLDRALD